MGCTWSATSQRRGLCCWPARQAVTPFTDGDRNPLDGKLPPASVPPLVNPPVPPPPEPVPVPFPDEPQPVPGPPRLQRLPTPAEEANGQRLTLLGRGAGRVGPLTLRRKGVILSISAVGASESMLAVASKDKHLTLWDTSKSGWEECADLDYNFYVTCFLFVAGSKYFITNNDNSGLVLRDGNDSGAEALRHDNAHTSDVTVLAALSDGRFASGGKDNRVQVWRIEGNQKPSLSQPVVLAGHTGGITALAPLPDGRLASGSADRAIHVWNLNTNACEAVLKGHKDRVTSLALLTDGRLASGSDDSTIRIWRIMGNSSSSVAVLGHGGKVLALAALPDNHLASGSADHSVCVWRVGGDVCNLLAALGGKTGHTGAVTALAALPRGPHHLLVSGSEDMTVRVWQWQVREQPE